MKPKVTVIGSINIDLITKVSHWPKPGETIICHEFLQLPGGKGANQAVAAARLGAEVVMLGCVGDDPFGEFALNNLRNEGVLLNYVDQVRDFDTGKAFITISEGDNAIIVVPGANLACTPEWLAKYEKVIAASDVILLQMEIPIPTLMEAARLAKRYGVKVVLNPAPFQMIDHDFLELIDVLTPNEHEYQQLKPVLTDYTGILIVTRGEKGVTLITQDGVIEKPAIKVKVADTTGAGDTFNGAFAAKWSETKSLEEAVDFAIMASALSVTKIGAQSGMPKRDEIDAFIKEWGGDR
jgi:ribokinase